VNKVGIFGKLAKLEQARRDGDRVEIYPPLIADPKQARKEGELQGRIIWCSSLQRPPSPMLTQRFRPQQR
jgi:hypothetical protein